MCRRRREPPPVTRPEEGLEAVALHEDPGEEPFCSPTDAPRATGRYRRQEDPRTAAANTRSEAERRAQARHGDAARNRGDAPPPGEERDAPPAAYDDETATHHARPFDPQRRRPLLRGTDADPNPRPYAHNRKARTERTLQPRTGSSLRTEHGPTDPVLGANPSSEGTDPFCRLPLPTLMPSTRGCTPWRPAADGGYGPARELRKNRTRIFQGRRKRTGRRPSRGALQVPFPYLRTSRFHGHGPLRRRENSSRGSRRRLRARLRHRGFARESDGRHRRRRPWKVAAANSVATPGPSPSPGSGILTRFPFDGRPAAGCYITRARLLRVLFFC